LSSTWEAHEGTVMPFRVAAMITSASLPHSLRT
jgi:hypothetical protein